jgi:hypothetical protein
VLETKTKTAYFRVTVPETCSKLRVAIRASGTPDHFFIHVHGVVHVIKEMGLATKFKEQVASIEGLKLDWEITKDAYSKCKKENKTKKDYDSYPAVSSANTVINKAQKTWDDVEAKAEVLEAQIFQLYSGLLSDESHQPWDKIIMTQMETAPCEDLRGDVHDEPGEKTQELLHLPPVDRVQAQFQ